jgi:hypothetical protein
MRKGMITLLCVAGLMLWGITTASALDLQWTLLTDASIAGKAPEDVGGGTFLVTPGAGSGNNCNFSKVKNCGTSTTVPAVGSFSFTAIEYSNPSWYSCLDLAGGATAGAPCVCAEGGACQSDADCASSSCAGAGDCCPGVLNSCKFCEDDPVGPDSFSFFGIDAQLGPAPNMDTCQKATGDNFETTRYHVATSESIPGSGGACIQLATAATNAPYLGAPCGEGAISSGILDVDVYAYGCVIVGTTIEGINYTGNVIDVTNGAPGGSCGYSQTQVLQLLSLASGKGASHLMILCGETVVPGDSLTACLRNAQVDFTLVAYTAQDASDCSGLCTD